MATADILNFDTQPVHIPSAIRPVPRAVDNLGLARAIACRFAKPGEPVEDTEQYADALIGLLKAEETYSPEDGKFSTWAYHCMNSAISSGFKVRKRSEIPVADAPEEIFDNLEDGINSNLELLETFLEFHESDSPKDRLNKEILIKHYLDRRTWDEIGEEYGFSKAAAQQRGQAAIRTIRAKFGI